MGVIRNLGLALVSTLLFFSILTTGITATINFSLTQDNVQPKVHSIVKEILEIQIGGQKTINEILPYATQYCEFNTEILQEFEGYKIIFPCTIIKEGYNSLVNYSVNYLIGDFYYKEYNCTFVDCFGKEEIPLFLFSNHSRLFWKDIYKKFFIISIVLFILSILLTKRKANAFFMGGSLMLVVSLIVLFLQKIGNSLIKIVSAPISLALSKETTNNIVSQIVTIFFSESTKVFFWMLGIGLLLIIIGIILRATNIGFKIGEALDKLRERKSQEKEKSPQKEISKPKQSEKQETLKPLKKEQTNKSKKK